MKTRILHRCRNWRRIYCKQTTVPSSLENLSFLTSTNLLRKTCPLRMHISNCNVTGDPCFVDKYPEAARELYLLFYQCIMLAGL